jgi:hypothetical protein
LRRCPCPSTTTRQGPSLAEAYNNTEMLDRNTEISTRFYGPDADCSIAGQGPLEASIGSNA